MRATLAIGGLVSLLVRVAWAGPPECPGAGTEPPLQHVEESCPASNCTTTAGSALEQIAVTLCNLNPIGSACGRCECCSSPTTDLFTGTTLQFAGGDPKNYCGLGGRGRQMGEAALCLLRDLAQPALAPPSTGGPGIHLERSGSMGIGNLTVKQHVGYVDFDIPTRRMRGFHSVSICAPVLGCVSNATQPFTATLINPGGGSRTCGDYEFVDPSWVLRINTERVEHSMFVTLGPFWVPTPVGPVKIEPQFNYELNFEPVMTWWAAGNNRVLRSFPCGPTRMSDVTDAYSGVLESFVGGIGASADGWDAYLGLGARDADPNGTVWTPPGGVDFPQRPDFDFTTARKDQEKRPTGRVRTGVEVSYGLQDLGINLNIPPLSLDEFYAYVNSHLDASFVSQFGISTEEGDLTFQNPDCHTWGQTRVRMQSALDAMASLEAKAGVVIDFELNLLFTSKHFRFNPEVTIFDPALVSKSLVVSPEARAEMSVAGPPPPYPAQYDFFSSLSAGPGNGRAFVDACLSEPPPAPQQPPQPSVDPGDPLDLIKGLDQPCNICLYFPGTVTQACLPKQSLVDNGTIPADYQCDLAINGMPCLDPNCENVPVSPPVSVNLKQVVFPVSQAGLTADKQWQCNAFEKFGCFDVCHYDPTKADPFTITQSAVDKIGTRCRDATGGSDPSKNGFPCNPDNGDAFCDDGNPCTEDKCTREGEFFVCRSTASIGPCDDGLYCNGQDSCALGICGAHTGNPCMATTKCCNEATDSCPASCDPNPCVGKKVGDPCDDGTACTTDDRCQSTPAGLRCAGTPTLSCASTTCTAGLCQDVAGQVQCTTEPNGACPPQCGNGVLDPGEQCDLPNDSACPGKCGPDCYCGLGNDNGESCTAANQCASNICVAGICCNTTCDGPLWQCNLPGKAGICSLGAVPVPALSPAVQLAAVGVLVGVAGLALRRRR